jgi:hypothetical protein
MAEKMEITLKLTDAQLSTLCDILPQVVWTADSENPRHDKYLVKHHAEIDAIVSHIFDAIEEAYDKVL